MEPDKSSGASPTAASPRLSVVPLTPKGAQLGRPWCPSKVVCLVTEVGERFAVLICGHTGVPKRMALRFSFDDRCCGGAARILQRLRRISDLYNWYDSELKCDLDALLLDGRLPRQQDIARALRDLGADRDYFVRKQPARCEVEPTPCSAAQTNQRIGAWLSFLRFASIPDNWRSGYNNSDDGSRSERSNYIYELSEMLALQRQVMPECDSHKGLSGDELVAIESVLLALFPNTRVRNVLIYRLLRFGGVRIGEALKIKAVDLPSIERAGSSALRRLYGEPYAVKIKRRPDDPDDTRTREARVKRGDRCVELPDDLVEDLQAYAKVRSQSASVSPYLFISSVDPAKPLSQSRAEKIIKIIGNAAHDYFSVHFPDQRSSLLELCWHRLRTTRAIEMVPHFFPGGVETESAKEEFILQFGWAAMDYAKPYLKELRRARGAQRIRDAQESFREISK